MVKEFERRLRVQDSVIKFLTVRIDETLKRLDKRKKEREKRAAAGGAATPLAQQMLAARRSRRLAHRDRIRPQPDQYPARPCRACQEKES